MVGQVCYWEGMTQEQAAAHLGCPLGTKVRSRMSAGRAGCLHPGRLTHRGLGSSGGSGGGVAELRVGRGAGLDGSVLDGPRENVASELIQSTVRAASQVSRRQGDGPAGFQSRSLLLVQQVDLE